MEKVILVIREADIESYDHFTDRILKLAYRMGNDKNVLKLKVALTTSKPPSISIIPFKKKKVAVISIHVKEDAFDKSNEILGFAGRFRAEEELPISYTKDWKNGNYSEGVCLLTLFKKKKSLDYLTFLDRWYNGHTPLSLKIHPLWNYNRNFVKVDGDHSEPWDGIVEEQFRQDSELLNPIKFFGNPMVMFYRMWQVYTDTKGFLDYNSIEPYFAREMHIKS